VPRGPSASALVVASSGAPVEGEDALVVACVVRRAWAMLAKPALRAAPMARLRMAAQLAGVGEIRGQAGDAVGDLLGGPVVGGAASVTTDAQHLGGTGPVDPGGVELGVGACQRGPDLFQHGVLVSLDDQQVAAALDLLRNRARISNRSPGTRSDSHPFPRPCSITRTGTSTSPGPWLECGTEVTAEGKEYVLSPGRLEMAASSLIPRKCKSYDPNCRPLRVSPLTVRPSRVGGIASGAERSVRRGGLRCLGGPVAWRRNAHWG
jgi:hypothetical protein